jgi:uncharacterized protein
MKIMKTMKYLFIAAAALTLGLTSVNAQKTDFNEKPKYDAKLAKKLGADEYGMKNYVFVILKTGPNDDKFKGKERDDIFAAHLANIGRLADEGKLALAGPFGKNDRAYRGLFIFNVATVEEAQKLVETDPTVKAGVLIAELTPWYGSASLMATPEIHKKIQKTKF